MAEEAVSRYLDVASSKEDASAIDFFISEKVVSEDRGSFSAAWLRGVERLKNTNLKRRMKADWEATKKARKEFWDQLEEQERDEVTRMYVLSLETSTVTDVVADRRHLR
jgi:hypothetical protein